MVGVTVSDDVVADREAGGIVSDGNMSFAVDDEVLCVPDVSAKQLGATRTANRNPAIAMDRYMKHPVLSSTSDDETDE
jgi:hypothetical protein